MSLEEKYFFKNEKSIKEVYKRVSKALALDDKKLQHRLFEYMSNGWYSPATPILLNLGTNLADGISCFLNTPSSDSLSDIMLAAHEMALLSKSGGGLGCDLSKIRGAGSPIKGGDLGVSSGIAPFAKMYEATILSSTQNKSRRGSAAIFLNVSHPDIEFFLTLRETKGDMSKKTPDLFTGVIINDKFMEDVLHNRDYELIDPHYGRTGRYLHARTVLATIAKTRHETGLPYIFFPDVANRMCLPEGQKKKGLSITQSSLCVAPETLILTSEGYKEIASLENQFVDVWNGEEWSNVQVLKTGENQELLKVTTECGREIECTSYHKFYIHGGKTSPNKTSKLRYKVKEVRAEELKAGDRLIKFQTPVIQGKKILNSAYEQGFFTGDGCFYDNKNIIYLYGDKRRLIDKFPLKTYHNIQENENRETLYYPNLLPKNFVPDAQYSIKSRLEWLAGYLDADGCVTDNKGSQSFQIQSINKDTLKKVQLMLQTLGVQSKVIFRREEGKFLLPKNDGSGENGLYNCKEVSMLCVGHFGITKLLELGLGLFRLKPTYRVSERYKSSVEQFVKIKSIERTGRISDTYCVNEPKRHKVVFNGLLTGNCQEITSIVDHNRTGTCILSCINLAKWDDYKDSFSQMVEDIVTSLDNVAQLFIDKNSGVLGKEKAVYSTWNSREIGIGWAGFHDYILSKGWFFDSPLARGFDINVTNLLREEAQKASKKLGSLRGECPDSFGSGYRNVRLLTMMPTASTSQLLKTSKSIEPYQSPAYLLKSDSGNKIIKLRQLENLIGKDNPLWLRITEEGSLKNIEEISSNIKLIYRNAFEISQQSIISMASERQKAMSKNGNMTHAQSVNLFYSKGASLKGMINDIITAWELNVPSLYYCITTKNSYKQDECLACSS